MKTENRNKRVVFTMGGKGGVGKTGLMVALAEWFEAHEIPFTLLDLDTENKARGSLKHFFNGSVTKVNIHTPAGLDSFIDHLESGASIILADMGAGSGQVASEWFDTMYEDVSAAGARFTAVGVITPDPASVESVLAWANRLQNRVQYVVVQNATNPQSNFSYWDSAEQAIRFRESLSPTVIRMEFRLAELENRARQHGVRLGQVAMRQNSVDELKRASIVMRAESYRRRLFSEFALLTRETPTEIAAERSRIQEILETSATQASAIEMRMEQYTARLESRLAQLPKELETGLDPPRIAKLLGESLRQSFQRSGLPDTTKALGQSCSELNSVQKQLVNVLREVAHPDVGMAARIRSANDSLLRSMAARAEQMDDYLVRLEKQVWAVWLPVVASAALALGFVLGTWFANMRRGTPEEPAAAQSKTLIPETPPLQVAPQRHPKHH